MISLLFALACSGGEKETAPEPKIDNKKIEEYKKAQKEAIQMLTSIKQHEESNMVLMNFYVDAEAYPKKPASLEKPTTWNEKDAGGFTTMAFSPTHALKKSDVFGSYSVSVKGDDFEVIGLMDLDGDGVQATFVASKSTEPTKKTADNIY